MKTRESTHSISSVAKYGNKGWKLLPNVGRTSVQFLLEFGADIGSMIIISTIPPMYLGTKLISRNRKVAYCQFLSIDLMMKLTFSSTFSHHWASFYRNVISDINDYKS